MVKLVGVEAIAGYPEEVPTLGVIAPVYLFDGNAVTKETVYVPTEL